MHEDYDERTEYRLERARKVCALPGLLLAMFGALAILLAGTWIIVSIVYPEAYFDFLIWYCNNAVPAGQMRNQMVQQYTDLKPELMLNRPMNYAFYLAYLTCSFIMFIGGLRMRALQSWGLALSAAIFATVPITGCSCFIFPLGIWALVVLCQPNVRTAFEITARRSA